MILSEKQLKVTRDAVKQLRESLSATEHDPDKDNWISRLGATGLRNQITELESDIAEYELLKSGQLGYATICSLSELPRVLVQARIALGLSQSDLAAKLNLKPQQIQRYEATFYQSASLARLIEVANALGVKTAEAFETSAGSSTGAVFSWAAADDISWNRFPLKEMLKRKWFSLNPGETLVGAAKRFFLVEAGPQFATALHRKKVRSGNLPNEYALLGWQARVLSKARNVRESVADFSLNDTWLNDLVQLTKETKGPQLARGLLASKGITLVIERHLPGTYLDGAAMLAENGNPIIALTLRYDRLDNFWFVLFHELGHVFLHLFNGLRFDFFDEEEEATSDDLEKEADQFALNKLIPTQAWDQCLSRFALSSEAVRNDAERLGIHPSIIAGRIRKERNNYIVLNDMVGANTVRSQFEEVE